MDRHAAKYRATSRAQTSRQEIIDDFENMAKVRGPSLVLTREFHLNSLAGDDHCEHELLWLKRGCDWPGACSYEDHSLSRCVYLVAECVLSSHLDGLDGVSEGQFKQVKEQGMCTTRLRRFKGL